MDSLDPGFWDAPSLTTRHFRDFAPMDCGFLWRLRPVSPVFRFGSARLHCPGKPPGNFVAFLRRYLQDEHKAKKNKELSGLTRFCDLSFGGRNVVLFDTFCWAKRLFLFACFDGLSFGGQVLTFTKVLVGQKWGLFGWQNCFFLVAKSCLVCIFWWPFSQQLPFFRFSDRFCCLELPKLFPNIVFFLHTAVGQ